MFASHALALRAIGVAGGDPAAELLSDISSAGIPGLKETLPVLLKPFFENAVVKLGRLSSPAPVALYYNPLLDIALLTLWKRQGERYLLVSIRVLPGERLADQSAVISLPPRWMTVKEEPVATLARITVARLNAFRLAHPMGELTGGRDKPDAAGGHAALLRLLWNAAMRERWLERTETWLPATLARIQWALAFRDAAVLKTVAPDTDTEISALLAELPVGFTKNLVLDMVLEIGGAERVLVGSLPDDGDIYVLALCRLEGGICALRRFMLASLFEYRADLSAVKK